MLKTIREGEKTTRQRGLFCAGMWKRENTVGGGGGKGNIDSVAPTTALAADQVKECGRAPTDWSRKEGKTERGSRKG